MRTRETYHHGDLRAALVAAAVTAARSGGAEAVRLNRLAAELGVSASAAYRHFPDGIDDLLVAVGDTARAELAGRIALRVGEVADTGDPVRLAVARFRASGRAYVEYVTEQPGLFQVACRHDRGRVAGADPHALLEQRLDDLVATGRLPSERRPWASTAAWATVHGLALLLTEGSLRRLPADQREQAVERALDVVERGL